jgi:uncharacterized protein
MKITPANRAQVNFIRAYAAGEVRIGETVVRSNCLVTASELVSDWSAVDAAKLTLAQLEPIFALQPEIVVLGTGMRQTFPAPQIHAAMLSRRIGFEVMDLGAACRTFNVLLSEDRPVLAALLLK